MNNLESFVNNYCNTLQMNDRYYNEFTDMTNQEETLREHRDYIEKNKLGFGDRAFHSMWYLLLTDLSKKLGKIRMLEIGVYKGQVISLWSLLVKKMNIPAEISAITPLEGNVSTNKIFNNRIVNKIRQTFSPGFRKCLKDGNNYLIEDYEKVIRGLFEHFSVPYDAVRVFRGYSNAPDVLLAVKGLNFDLIYIDGDHSYEGALADIRNYSALIQKGGYLVMDDASYFLEGSSFWKGHKEVSRACEIIEGLGFKNILNIGHNRVYERI
jgi:hypothetical protein